MGCTTTTFHAFSRRFALLVLLLTGTIPLAMGQVSISGLASQYCETDADVTMTGSPSGGAFSGPGVTGSTFSPSTAGPGTHLVAYDPLSYDFSGTSFTSITGGGTTISLGDDANSGAIPIGFTFPFYNTSYTQCYISSNGFISFDAGAPTNVYAPCLGNTAAPNNTIFFYGTDLDPGNGLQGNGENRIWYTTVGTPPNRQFRVTFWRVDQFPDANNVFIRLTLFETSGNFRVDIQSAPSDGGNVTIGVEGASGFHATGPSSCFNSGTFTNSSILFTPTATSIQPVEVFETPSTANAGSNQTVVVNNTTLGATAPTVGTGEWTVVSGSGTFADSSVANTTVTGLSSGANVFRWTVSNGTCTPSTSDVTITFNSDTQPPSVACPADQVGAANGSCQFVLLDYRSLATVTDNLDPNPVVTQDPAAGTTISANTAVTIIATDNAGNVDSCDFNVVLTDNTNPSIICPADQNDFFNTACQFSIPDYTTSATVSDNCAPVANITVTQSPTASTVVSSNQSIMLTATDTSGNSDNCSFSLTLADSTSPTAVCNDLTVVLSGNSASITAADVNNGSSDNCTSSGLLGLSVSPSTFNCSNVGSNTVTLTVTDQAANTGTCTSTVTVQDTTPPTAICFDITTQLNGAGSATITPADIDNGSSDACGIGSLSASPTSFNCASVGTNTVTLTVNDVNGNSSTCTSIVTVQDTASPTAVCQNLTVHLDGTGNTSITAADVDNGSSDNCGVAGISVSPTSFNCANVGSNTVTLTVTDVNGNNSTCTSTVTVQDSVSPTAVCQNLTVHLNGAGNASITAGDVDNGSSDNCGVAGISVTPSSFTCANVGSNTTTLTVTDVNGNNNTCTSTVTVLDSVSPTAVCQNITVHLNGAGNASIFAGDIDNGSSDNCGVAGSSVTPSSFTCANVGSNTTTLTVTDVNGNNNTCTSTVTVQDSVSPTAVCQNLTVHLNGAGNASITAGDVDNGSSDNCGVAGISVSPSSFNCANVGSNTTTLTVTDVNGNNNTCTSTVTVQDSVSPTAVCQNLTVHLNGAGNASITAGDVDNGSSDNCGVAGISVTPSSFTCANVGSNTTTLTVTDVNGNNNTCTSTVTVQDSVSPTAVCQNLTVHLDGTGNASITAGDVDNGSSDNCGVAGISVTPSSFNCANVGSNTTILTVTDVNGNNSTCTSTVTVQDSVSPTAVCQNLTVHLNGAGNASITAGDVDNGSSDNCGVAGISVTPSSFTCANVGSNTVTLTVTDVNGNNSTCTSTVTVQDSVSPTAVCQNLTVHLDGTGNTSITAGDVDNGSSDNCGVAGISVTPSSFTCANVGSNTVTLTVTDVNGNNSTCTSTVTVEDTVPPTAVCQNITVQLDGTGNASITAGDVDGGSSDNCGVAGINVSPSSFNCANVGSNTVTLTVTDVNGNNSTCTSTVTVEDTIPPTAVCQNITVQLDGTGNASITAGDVDNGSSDNCGVAGISVSPSSFTCANVGSNTATLTVTDVNGNNSTCTSTVTIEDTVPPTAVCQNITVQLDGTGNTSITAGDVDGGSSDNCGVAGINVSPSSFNCANVGSNTVTLTVTDVNGNNSTCTSTVTVEDTIPPTAVCQNITVQLDGTGNASITAGDVDGGSSDNCGVAGISVSPSSFNCANVGSNTATLTVTDVNGNNSTCTSTVTIQDTVPPTAVCQNITVQLDGTGNASITAGDVDGGSSDNCGVAGINVSPSSFNCANVGSNTVTLTVTDVNGNNSTCTSTVTIEDTVPPTAVCQNITVQLDGTGNASITAGDVDGGSSDNCGVAGISVSPSSFNCANVGSNTVTLTVTDVNGNSSTCTSNVTAEDTIPPTAVCQNITAQLDGTGNASITASDVDGGSSDNCGVAGISVSPSSFNCANVGSNTVTLTVTDVNGNNSTCTSTVTIQDTVPPTAVCQNITIQLDGTGNASITAGDVDNGSSDNCSVASTSLSDTSFTCADEGNNSVTLTVVDVNGNSSTCSATVTVEDTFPAVFNSCPANIVAGNLSTACISGPVNYVTPTASSVCGIDSIRLITGLTSGGQFPVGVTPVVYVAYASAQNDTCSFTVTVTDTTAPQLTGCLSNTTIYVPSTSCQATYAWTAPIPSDNCPGVNLSASHNSPEVFDAGSVTISYTATDNSGNTSSCSWVVTIEDTIPPVWTNCPADINISSPIDICGAVATWTEPTASDNCELDIAAMDTTHFPGDTFALGMTTVHYVAVDTSGLVDTCSFTVTVTDTTAPVITCNDVTVQLDATGMATIDSSDVLNSFTDVCGIATATLSDDTFDCSEVGPNVITVMVTDNNGNSSSCTSTVTVEDTLSPNAICQDITVQLDASGAASIVAADVNNGSNDNCAVDVMTVAPNTFNCSNVGANTVTLTVTDVNGNSSTCTSTVTIEDTVPPVAICQNITIQLDATGNATITASDVDGGSTDACGVNSLAVDIDSFNCASVNGVVPPTSRAWINEIHYDNIGADQNEAFEVAGTAGIDLTGWSVEAYNGSGGALYNTFPLAGTIPNSSNGFGVLRFPATGLQNGSPDGLALIDDLGNVVEFLSYEGSFTASNGAASGMTSVNIGVSETSSTPVGSSLQLTGTGSSAGDFTWASASAETFGFPNTGQAFTAATGSNPVVLTVTDNNGNSSTCTAQVTVQDTTSPVALCQDVTVSLDATGNGSITAADVDNGSSDACGIDSLSVSPSAFTCPNVGNNTVTLTATDVNGNTNTCTANVTVNDSIAPVAICQDITVQLDATGNASITASDVDGGSSDACGIAGLSVSPSTFNCANVGANTVTLTVTDVNGNSSTCNAFVTIEDTIAPTALCQDLTLFLDNNGQATINTGDVDNGSSDNCSIASLALSDTLFTCADTNGTTVTLTVTDVNGNVSTCTSNITLSDTTAPIAVCQDLTLFLDNNGQASITTGDVDNGSSDNCGIASLVLSDTSFTCADTVGVTVTLTVTDVSSNVSTCTSNITLSDTTAPIAVCQDLTLFLDSNGDASTSVVDVNNGSSDNCGIANLVLSDSLFTCADTGSFAITMTATDVSGNASSCTSNITLSDTTAPIAVCQDLTLFLDSNGQASITTGDVDNGSSDNCGIASLVLSDTSFTCADTAGVTVTLTVTDVSGNASTCTSNITLNDTTAPIAVCQDLTLFLDNNGQASITTGDVDNGSSDNCGIASLVLSDTSFTCADTVGVTVTLTVTDVSSNVSTCTSNITLSDTTAPIAICQDLTLFLDSNGAASTSVVDVNNGSSDNCGIANLVLSDSLFTCADTGSFAITMAATDVSGNASSCTSNITLSDTTAPIAVCQDLTLFLDSNGQASITTGDVDNGSSDNCGIASLVLSDTSFTCADTAGVTVTLTVTDVSGNASTCTSNITLNDTTAPIAVCQDLTLFLDNNGQASITTGDVDNGSSDNCGIASLVLSDTSFTCADTVGVTVTLTVTDVSSNVSTCTSNITLSDTTAPIAICQDLTLFLDSNGDASTSVVDVNNGSSDNCGIANLVLSDSLFTCADTGSFAITMTATDVSGNASSCTSNITLSDTTAPIAVCQDLTLFLDSNGQASITTGDVDNGSSDNCGIASLVLSDTSFTCADTAGVTVTLTVTDVSGNASTCTSNITLNDTTAPIAVCQDLTLFLDNNGQASITTGDVDNGSSDNCGIASLVLSDTSFTCADTVGVTVTLTVTDVSSNVSTCTSNITLSDTTAPIAVCQNITVQLDSNGLASIVPTDVDGGSSDNCGIASLALDNDNFDCSSGASSTVTLTVTDVSSNVSTCTAVVTIEDTIPATALCQDTTIYLDTAGVASIDPSFIDDGSFDNCGIDSLSVSPSDFACGDEGPNTVTLTVTDNSSNVSTCTATVTVLDTISPVIAACPNNQTVNASPLNCGAVVFWTLPTASDNCSIDSLTASHLSGTIFPVGTTTVTYIAYDPSLNTDTCTFDITVIDNQPPVITNCPTDIVQGNDNGQCGANVFWVTPFPSDNCPGVTMTSTHVPGTFFPVGTTTVTYVATDLVGNTDTCSFTITVNDTEAPVVVCPSNIAVNNDSSFCSAVVNYTVTSSDNCGSSSEVQIAGLSSGSAFPLGTTINTYVASDTSGNSDTCSFTVTVTDAEAPIAVCNDITVQLDATGNTSITGSMVDGGSTDNCGIESLVVSPDSFTCANVGANTVTLTVTDSSGNSSTCTANVTVEDSVAPVAICQDITVQLDAGGAATITGTDIDGGSTDACGIASLVANPDSFSCANVGSNTVTLTVTDVNGNSSTCTSNVTVEDSIAPVAICQDITVQLDTNGAATITAADIDNGSNDACGIDSLSATPTSFSCANVGSNTVTLTVTDVNGNVSTCTANVTVEDSIAPTAICQDITVQLDATGNATITAVDIDNGSNDNCGIASLAVNPDSFACANVGSNTVTLTVTDVNGNVSTCTANVTVEDSIAPVAICQDITVQLDATGNATITSADVDNGSNDACGIANLVVAPDSFTCANVGTNTVTLTATDVNGNSATCTATVTVEDSIAPVAICQDITVQLDSIGAASITAADIDNGSNDACGIDSLSVTPTSFSCANVGSNTVTLTVTDVNGNVSTCTANVTVEDSIAPTAICQDITVQLDATGNATIAASDVDNGSNDNCGIASLAVNPDSFACANVGSNTVTLTVTDVNGNVSTCTANVTVEDSVAPVAICQDITVQLDATGNTTITASDVDNGSNDACGIASLVVAPDSFTCANVGTNTVTLTVTDVNGNSATCTSTVTVEDSIAPVAICQNITVQLDATGNASIVASDIDNGSNDACGIDSLSVSPNSFTCSNVGSNSVTLTVTDVNGNVSTCTGNVTVEDSIAPVAICQDITVQLDATGNATITAADVDNGSNDACGIANLVVAPDSFTCANVGTNTVTLTATDVNGNSATCTATVTVEDSIAPVAICQDITVQLDTNGVASITAADIDNGSNDACGIDSLSATPTSFSCANAGSNTVTLTVTDVNGNVSTCTANVTVEDSIAPTAICQDITVQLDATGNATIAAADIDNGSNDNCGIDSLSASPNSFTCSNVGSNTVTLTVTDVNGNVSTCTANVTVEDSVAPVAICQDITVQLDSTGNATITAADVDNGSNDACGIASLVVAPDSFTCANVGTNTVTLTVTDVNGNVSTCTANVTVEDSVAPVAICQDLTVYLDANGSASINAADVDNGSSDACGIAGLSIDQSTFDCSNVGSNTVTLTVTDVNGNSSTCTSNVTVEDTIPPTAVCQDITIHLDSNGSASITPSDVDGGSSDNCGIASLAVDQSIFDCSDVGVNTVTLTVTDVNGNISTCTANVTVLDSIAPTAICQDITVQLDSMGNTSITASDVDNGSNDACGIASLVVSPDTFTCANVGANTVILTVMDSNNNVSTCTAIVTVEDSIAPVAICQDITIQVDTNGTASITAADIDNGSNDACGIDSLSASPASFDCSNLGGNTVTLTVTDVNGNVSTCTSNVTVEDTIAPTITCPANISVSNDSSFCGADVTWAAAQTNDNCSVDTVIGTASSGDFFPVGHTLVTLVVTDISGNADSCSFTVTVTDDENPILVCPADTTFIADSASCATNVNWNLPLISDNCGIDFTSSTVQPGSTLPVGTTLVTYYATDSAGNMDSCSFNVIVDAPTLAISTSSPVYGCGYNISCNGVEDGAASVAITGGCSPYTVVWSNGDTTLSIDSLDVGVYTVTVTDSLGTSVVDSITLTQPDPLTVVLTSDSLVCFGDSSGSITLAVDGGHDCAPYDFLWNTGDTTQNLVNLTSGFYAVTITDTAGCTVQTDVELQSLPLPLIDLGPDTTVCSGSPITLDPGAGFDGYQWSTGDSTQTITVNTAGTYSVTVSDVFGCVNSDSVEITNFVSNEEIIQPREDLIICIGDTLVLTADSGYVNYDWSTGENGSSIVVAGFGGPITLVATDTNGCATTDSVFVTFNNVSKPEPVILPGDFNLCEGSTVVLDASNGYFSYDWNTGDTTSTILVDSSGQFCVTVTNGFGCVGKSDTVTVTEVPNPTPTIFLQNDTLFVNGTYAGYQWNRDGNLIPGAILDFYPPQIAGWYSITVMDSNGCEGVSDSIFVDPSVSAEGATESIIGLDLFPNPTSGIINVRTESPINWDVDITVMDMYGHVVKTFRVDYLVDVLRLDLTDVANGMYLLKIEDEKGRSNMLRFMIE